MNTKKLRIVVLGRVQGVGYRRFAQRAAEQRGILGWTRNLNDGSVEVKCQGDAESIKLFLEDLKKGSGFSHVRELLIREIDEEIGMEGFRILPDGDR